MNKILLAFCLTIISGVVAFAQSDIKRVDFYVGYSNNQVETGDSNLFLTGSSRNLSGANSTSSNRSFFDRRTGFNGIEVAAAANVSRFFGIKGDFSATGRVKEFNNVTAAGGGTSTNVNFRTRNELYNFLGGVQIKDNSSEARIKPFAHALVGVGYGRTRVRDITCSGIISASVCSGLAVRDSDTGLAAAFGGGLDVKLSNRVGLRLVQVDYNPVHLNGRTLDNVRFGGGITF